MYGLTEGTVFMNVKNTIVKAIVKIVLIIGALQSAGCSAKQSVVDDDRFLTWRIGAAISYHFPAIVSQAYGVNYKEDWTSMMLSYGNLTSGSRLNLDEMRKHSYSEYQGNILPLHGLINFTPNQLGLGTKTLPDELYIYWWVSNSETEYATVVEVTDEIKAAMTKAYPHPSWRFEGQNCYQTDFIFGLLPDGRAKLWLKGCRIYTYVGEFQPTKVMPPKDPSHAKNKQIPWDEVNQVWYNKERFTMQNLEDV
jgi:hypothetical protein